MAIHLIGLKVGFGGSSFDRRHPSTPIKEKTPNTGYKPNFHGGFSTRFEMNCPSQSHGGFNGIH